MTREPFARPAAVAGLFYPGNPESLREAVCEHLAGAGQTGGQTGARAPKAVIAPHAGYIYSGPTAGYAFAPFAERASSIKRVVILGPAHRVPVRGLALPGAEAFETPLGSVPVDLELAERIADLPQVEISPVAHELEHSLEVEIPFLQVVLDEFAILPLVVGDASPREVVKVLDLVWGGEETAIVVSSDLSHFLSYEEARRIDAETVERIRRLAGRIRPNEACGAYPVNGLLEAAEKRGLAAEVLDVRNSGDTAGDRDRVVGYAAIAFN